MTVSGGAGVDVIVKALQKHVAKSGTALLNVVEPKILEDSLASSETENVLKLFASDPQINALIVQKKHKRAIKADEDPNLVKENEYFVFELQVKPLEDSNGGAAIAYIKSHVPLEADKAIAGQLQVCHLDEANPFQTILSYVKQCFLPLSRVLMANALEKNSSQSEIGTLRGVSGKLGELEVELMRSQESVVIPRITLEVDSKIAEYVGAKGANAKVSGLDGYKDADYLNQVQAGLNEWKKQIVSVTKLTRDVDAGTTMQEINFWNSMEAAIQHIYEQKESAGVDFTFKLLNENKRFIATTGFAGDVGLADDKSKDSVFKYTALLKDLPIKELLSATDCQQLKNALDNIFNHLKQIKRIEYPLARAIQLVQAISRDLSTTLQSVVNASRPMALSYEEFDKTTAPCQSLFMDWDTQYEGFSDEIRDLKKTRSEEDILTIGEPCQDLLALRTRLTDVRKIRKEHEELRSVVSDTLSHDPVVQSSASKAIAEAYQHLKDVDILATSKDGVDLYEAAVASYKGKIDNVEKDLEGRIREMLTAAKDDANEMFRVCSKFNALFVRPRIQSAIREYQEQLIATVKKDIEKLQDKFKSEYTPSDAKCVSDVRDIPPVSGSIIWGRQIERQLDMYVSRIEDVLGAQWVHHHEGRNLKRESDQFRDRLQPATIFQDWLNDNKAISNFEVEGRIFKVVPYHSSVRLSVNFDRKMITLFKEVRNLNRLGLKVPYEIKIASDEAKEKYPYAMRLEEVIRTYMRTSQMLSEHAELEPLAASYKKNIQDGIAKGLNMQWDSENLKEYVDQLGTQTVEYLDQVDELLRSAHNTKGSLKALVHCAPSSQEFSKHIGDIQSMVDHLDKRGYSNMFNFVAQLDGQIEKILVDRLKSILKYWAIAQDLTIPGENDELDLDALIAEEKARKEKEAANDWDNDAATREAAADKARALDFVVKEPAIHRITIRNQVLQMDPPLEGARLHLVKILHSWMSMIGDLPRLKCFWSASEKSSEKLSTSDATFRSALGKLSSDDVQQCFDKIDSKMSEASAYSNTWLHYQALWDMDFQKICEAAGTDVHKWEKLLVDVKSARANFDNTSTTKRFGCIVVEYGSVQTKVNNKYDQWQKNLQTKFSELLGGMIDGTFKGVSSGRQTLEKFKFDFSTTKNIIDSVTLLQGMKNKSVEWNDQLQEEVGAETLLQKNRFQFPNEWVYTERVASEFESFDQILKRKLAHMEKNSDKIEAKIKEESKVLEGKVTAFVADWRKNRPTGDGDPKEVMAMIENFDTKCTDLQSELDRMALAREALKLPKKDELRLIPVREEIDGIKGVWDILAGSFRTIETIGGSLFRECDPKQIRRDLSRLQSDILRLPGEVRQYAGYEYLKTTVKDLLSHNALLTDLGSGVLRSKHQKQILKILKIDDHWNNVTVLQLWNADMKRHLKQIRHILEQAQGESALEEFLAEVAAQWEALKLILVDYRGKTYLIKNWDDIFEQLGNNLSDLQSMKHSPFYPAFEQEAQKWEAKLNYAQAIFDIFIDVQRRWVYLEGIFNSSKDVQAQLAYQYKQFCGFDRDFVRLMREMKKEDQASYWCQEDKDLLKKVELWKELLDAIQKALAEFLEKQRRAFPRFYFVGDEDLLEIIGNSSNILKLIRHLPKMFAGIAGLTLDDENTTIVGMESKEGEMVKFNEKIKIPEHKTIHSWLLKIESQMRETLASQLGAAVKGVSQWSGASINADAFLKWVDTFPAQIVLMAIQVYWCENVEKSLTAKKTPEAELDTVVRSLEVLADHILSPDLTKDRKCKYEQLITELVHQRDVSRDLIAHKVISNDNYEWLRQMRFYYNVKPDPNSPVSGQVTVASPLICKISRATFNYGFEYLGLNEKLVQTPLTDRCYLTLSEALHMRLGGNPYGPAGTGKTETVKALGSVLGRFVLVFNCDENFDFNSMGRILVGLCQCGAWGCFDEFNRLEERILSAVSQQILTIQTGLKQFSKEITLLNKSTKLNDNIGVFVTMNPGYAGRSNLPDNLKQLFRGIAMIKPNTELISQVMLYSQGFRKAEDLASKVVLLFQLCSDQLSSQSHYDFGLRALKSVLRSCGNLKRDIIATREAKDEDVEDVIGGLDFSSLEGEQAILIKSFCGTIVPKLVSQDIALFETLLTAVFPDAKTSAPSHQKLRDEIAKICEERWLVAGKNWVDKIMQLYDIQKISHGVINVGPAGTGKSTAWTVLKEAMERVEETRIQSYLIDPKAINKNALYGSMDSTTGEWTDGVFTDILRKIIDNVRNEQQKIHWIVFDGDVDPEWAENLNSVLDDNKLFTLPNGERLALTPNIRIMFEVKDLNHATPATVSRCGMVWFSKLVLTREMLFENLWIRLGNEPITSIESAVYNRWKTTQQECADSIKSYFVKTDDADNRDFLMSALDFTKDKDGHVMEFSDQRALISMFSLLKAGVGKIINYNDEGTNVTYNADKMKNFMEKQLVYAVLWGFSGDMPLKDRMSFGSELHRMTSIPLPSAASDPLVDWEVKIDSAEWELWADRVPSVDLDASKVIKPDEVIQTVDTVRHVDVIGSWLGDHRPLLLCGPPGSGKSMTLTSVLTENSDNELVTLNFSSSTGPELIMQTLKHYCSADKTPAGITMRPLIRNKWLVIFCDEINLPEADDYDTQHVVTLLRQITEHGGFWRPSDMTFISLERVQIIGACNPPSDAGRVSLTNRFLRHCPLMFVDFPSVPSLKQIYGTLNKALLKLQPPLRSHADSLTDAMVEVYSESQQHFTPDMQPHYIYSPRELSRWVRAMYEAMNPENSGDVLAMGPDDLVRLWAHEALRLFSDRLVEESEREWTDNKIDEVAYRCFHGVDMKTALARPILFSNWLTKSYESVGQAELREHVKLRLQVFREEELDVKLVVFDEVLDHILRIDRVLQQPLGHLLLVGASGGGKTVLSKFVSWMKGMSVFQIKVHKFYKAEDFDHDLREVLLRSGCGGEKICFIFDESNVLDSAFLERMNALLASGEVPGLFEGPDWDNLMEQCKQSCARDGLIINREGELYKHFCSLVQRNLHVVFTMNPSNEDFDNRSATSPALFNRCVIDWFGEWSTKALYQVGHEYTMKIQLSDALPGQEAAAAARAYDSDEETENKPKMEMGCGSERDNIVNSLVFVHETVIKACQALARNTNRRTYVTPRHFLDFISHYAKMSDKKREELEEQQRHLKGGLRKLVETQEEVAVLKQSLGKQEVTLKAKEQAANAKLEQMMVDKTAAEQKKEASEQIAKEIEIENEEINQKKAGVEAELECAKPALLEARNAVKDINKTDLDQVSRYPNPPAPVKLALEPVLLMLGEKIDDWQNIRKILRRTGETSFINSIVNYDVDVLKAPTRKKIEETYIADPGFNFEVVNRASKACGPLVKWVSSVVKYATIKNSVQPLLDSIAALEEKSKINLDKQAELNKIRAELGERIDGFKVEYSALVGEAQAIKNDMSGVVTKCERSEKLLANLGVEQKRWAMDAEGFEKQLSTIVGDSVVAAAFVAYIGYFNQQYRTTLVSKWLEFLKGKQVKCRDDISVINFLSNAGERLEWTSNKLPDDDLCVENAIMMKHFNRYPLIIDPSGQAVDFLMKQYSSRKICRTSFLDSGFLKNLESSLRFGNALLVEDVESLDPILNSVLNKEIFRQGGRVMITLGDKEIDFSPSFVIFLATRDPSCHFTPDLCSRVTFVNFTVTHSSLTTQCMSKVLKVERPDIDKKRTDMLKLQGEFRFKLRMLEDKLLTSLSSVQGNILDDLTVINSLETLKQQSEEVMESLSKSDEIMKEVDEVSAVYRPFAIACSAVYFSLENLGGVYFLYQYSLQMFFDIVNKILFEQSEKVKAEQNPITRLQLICKELFALSYERVSRSLLIQDQIGFAARLAQIARQVDLGKGVHPINADDLDFFLKGRSRSSTEPSSTVVSGLKLTAAQKTMLGYLLALPSFSNLKSHLDTNISDWKQFMIAQEDEKSADANLPVPAGWEKSKDKAEQNFHHAMVAKVFRPDFTTRATANFVNHTFGDDFLNATDQVDLKTIVTTESKASSPLLLVSKPGYDASGKVDALAQELGKTGKYEALAMGSPEGYDMADRAVTLAAKSGTWVILKNVHLSPEWLQSLEKRLHRLTPHENFRLFLTMEINPKVPANLLRMSTILIFEPPVGIKSALVRMFNTIEPERFNKAPVERGRLYFLLIWIHSVILERLRYAPVGWTKKFEFSEMDAKCALDAIDEWVDKKANGKANLPPSAIPWDALQQLLEQIIYGGRIDNEFDQARLHAFVQSLFNKSAYDGNFPLCQAWSESSKSYSSLLTSPDARDYAGFKKWIAEMASANSPELLGLPNNANDMLLSEAGNVMCNGFLQLQDSTGAEADLLVGSTPGSVEVSKKRRLSFSVSNENVGNKPQWMVLLEASASSWLQQLPQNSAMPALPSGEAASKLVLNPIYRCMQREYNTARSLLDTVRSDCGLVHAVLTGKEPANNRARDLFKVLQKDQLPSHWISSDAAGTGCTKLPTSLWIQDLAKRATTLAALSKVSVTDFHKPEIWMGGMLTPEAFCAATRQAVAQAHSWSLEDLELLVTVNDSSARSADSFSFSGMLLQGATWAGNSLAIDNTETTCNLPTVRFTWVKKGSPESKVTGSYLRVPCYLDFSREKFLFSINLKRTDAIADSVWNQRGVCVTLWSAQ